MRRLAPVLFSVLLLFAAARTESAEMPLLEHFEERSEVLPSLPCTVLRFDADITGDGTPELFLAPSQTSGSSGVEMWFVYARLGNDRCKFLGALGFSYLLFEISEEPRRLITYYDTQRGTGALVTFRLDDGGGFQEESRQEGVSAWGAALGDFETWRTKVGLRILSADLKDLKTSADPKWTDLLKNEVVPGVGPLTGLVELE